MTELGKRLKQVREEKGITLDDLQEITKIQKRYLSAIEQGKYEIIPGKFYVRAFIKQYAEAVGLEPDILFEEYRSDIPSINEEGITEAISRSARKNVSRGSSKFFEILPKIILTAFIVGALFLVWHFAQEAMKNSPESQEETQNSDEFVVDEGGTLPEESEKKETPQNVNSEIEGNTEETEDDNEEEKEQKPEQELVGSVNEDGTSTYQLSNAEKFEVRFSVVSGGRSWIRIADSAGSEIYQGTLSEGNPEQVFDVTDETNVSIRIGNVPATEIYINDQKLEYVSTSNTQTIYIEYVAN